MATLIDLQNAVERIRGDDKVLIDVWLHRLDKPSIGEHPIDAANVEFPIFSRLLVNIKMQPNARNGNTLYVGQSVEMRLIADWLDMDAVIEMIRVVIEPMLKLKSLIKGEA